MAPSMIPASPPVLRGPLVFGDPEQIKELRQYEAVVAEYTDGDLVQWEVEIEVSASRTVKRCNPETKAAALANGIDSTGWQRGILPGWICREIFKVFRVEPLPGNRPTYSRLD